MNHVFHSPDAHPNRRAPTWRVRVPADRIRALQVTCVALAIWAVMAAIDVGSNGTDSGTTGHPLYLFSLLAAALVVARMQKMPGGWNGHRMVAMATLVLGLQVLFVVGWNACVYAYLLGRTTGLG